MRSFISRSGVFLLVLLLPLWGLSNNQIDNFFFESGSDDTEVVSSTNVDLEVVTPKFTFSPELANQDSFYSANHPIEKHSTPITTIRQSFQEVRDVGWIEHNSYIQSPSDGNQKYSENYYKYNDLNVTRERNRLIKTYRGYELVSGGEYLVWNIGNILDEMNHLLLVYLVLI